MQLNDMSYGEDLRGWVSDKNTVRKYIEGAAAAPLSPEGPGEVPIDPRQRGLLDHVLARGDHHQLGIGADPLERVEGARDGRDLLGKVAALEELVHDAVGFGLVAVPDLGEHVLRTCELYSVDVLNGERKRG
jgi:hypothetical protein